LNKTELWTKLESLMMEDDPLNGRGADVECVYNQSSSNREVCDVCQSNLVITEEGFATCTNPNCSIIYKDVLDHSAEWRF